MATISIRGLEDRTVEKFNRSAKARGMSQAQYLDALVELHAACRGLEYEWGIEKTGPDGKPLCGHWGDLVAFLKLFRLERIDA